MRALALLVALAACKSDKPAAPAPETSPEGAGKARRTRSTRTSISRVDLGAHRGLSGLTRDATGRLWTVPERGHQLVGFDADGGDQIIAPIRDLAGGIDLESLTWLDGRRFAAGTESRDPATGEAILILEVAGRIATIADRIAIDMKAAGVDSPGNQGIEGLCAAGSILVAALETPIEVDAVRATRLVRIDRDSGAQTFHALRLTSKTGKISGLDCRRRGAAIEILAIERHFEVARILRFELADSGGDRLLEPTIAADLDAAKRPTDNPEGISGAGGFADLILDNDFGGVKGPSELLRVPLADSRQ
jgi:hypothetical protein